MPYLGFYGDWGKPAIFDELASDGWGHTMPSGIYNGVSGNILGCNPVIKTSDLVGLPRADRYVISRSDDFRIDTVAPVVSNLEYKGEGTDMALSFDVTDASLLAAIDLHDPADGLWFYRHIFTDDEATTAADGTRAYHVEIPFKDIAQAWTDQGGSGTADACTSPEGGHWVKDGAGWWYACTDGTSYLKDGWFTINGSDYLFGPSGAMLTGTQVINGRTYVFDANGIWIG